MVIEIKLTQGKVAIINDIDSDLANFKWYALKKGKYNTRFYAVRHDYSSGKDKLIYIHRIILERMIGRKLENDEDVDHVNHNGLNNTRDNLRLSTHAENVHNQSIYQKPKSSKYKGVCWNKQAKSWQAYIKTDGKHIHLGYFDSEEEAAFVYNQAAKRYFGEFACLNPVMSVAGGIP